MANSEKASEAIRGIRSLLGEWLRTSKESREPVAKIIDLLEEVDAFLRASSAGPSTKIKSSGRIGATYTIEKDRNSDEVLMEHRAGGKSNPFRCPKFLYDAIVKVLVDAEAAVDFGELTTGVTKLSFDPAEFQLRAAIRFLLSQKPPLIVRDRKRYRPIRRGKFEKEAATTWAALARTMKRQA